MKGELFDETAFGLHGRLTAALGSDDTSHAIMDAENMRISTLYD